MTSTRPYPLDTLAHIAIQAALNGFFEVKHASGQPMKLEDKGGRDACTYWDNYLEVITKKLFQEETPQITVFADDNKVYYTPCIGSASYGLCSVASGRLGAYMIIGVDINDIYPGMLLVQEAGGVTSDQFGRLITRDSGTLVASANQIVHRFLLDAIRPAAENKDIESIWKYRKVK